MTRTLSRSAIVLALCVVGLLLAAPSDARAQGFISGLVGYNFSGDSGCPTASNCENKHNNLGGSVGVLGIIGFEEELAYAQNFFGKTPDGKNSVLTLMSNVMIAPGIGPVNPYVLGGVGLMRTHTDFTPAQIVNISENQFAWDVGGGAIVFFGHVGVRGDLRHFHSFQDTTIPFIGTTTGGAKIDFARLAGAVVIKF